MTLTIVCVPNCLKLNSDNFKIFNNLMTLKGNCFHGDENIADERD